MPEVLEKKRAIPMINPTRMRLAEYDRQEWIVNAELGTTVEEVLDPVYWTHMAELMKPYDHIEVRVDDGSWLLRLLVISADRSWAKVKLLDRVELVEEQSVPQSVKYRVEWKGPQHKWTVIRLSDGEKLHHEDSKAAAYAWMVDHERTVS